MPEDRYNIVFAGVLLGGADAAEARARLGGTFRLDSAQLDNLFSGRPIVVKRDVDLMTATRFQQAFLAAGARAEIEAVGVPAASPDSEQDLEQAATAKAETTIAVGDHLALAPIGAPLDEIDDRGPPRNPDTSALSLVPADGWDLSDCAPLPVPTQEYDLSDLTLAPLDARRPGDGQ